MPILLYVTTACLAAAFVFFCVGAGRIDGGHSKPRPFAERAALAVIFGLVGWQALTWVRADQPAASQARIIGVWVQLFSAFGISGVMIAHGWLAHRPPARG